MNWADVLEEMEKRVADAKQVIMAGGAPPSEFSLPDDIGPLPPELRARATAVYVATVALQRKITKAQAGILEALRRGSRRPPATASFVDQRA
jgi:hypothetical protein